MGFRSLLLVSCLALGAVAPAEAALFPSHTATKAPGYTAHIAATSFSLVGVPAADQLLNTESQTTYYGAPFRHGGCYMGYCGPFGSLSSAITEWWSIYQAYWSSAFPGCTYTLAFYGYDQSIVASTTLHGTCGGGQNFYSTAYSYDPHKNGGAPGGCCGVGALKQ